MLQQCCCIALIVFFYATVHLSTVVASPCRCPSCLTSGISCTKSAQCSAPVICRRRTCPVATPCQVVVPCPPCITSIIQQPVLVEQQVTVPIIKKIPIFENTCCSTCSIPCMVRKKREISGKIDLFNDLIKLSLLNPLCNSKTLQQIMDENIRLNVAESQRSIQNVLESQLNGHFNVLCSNGKLIYTTFTTSIFCQHQKEKENIICYAFKTPEFH
uniref:Ground-like domain-containing protein n=1 Tax=Setaria digitata TaxID=48799 RepID=A0A915PR45_9BILA